MVKIQPAIYVGTLRHRRFLPKPHQFIYPIFMVCLDVDRISEMMSVSPFTGHNRWNWASFFDEDHFGNSALALRERLALEAQANLTSLPGGKVLLLTHLRYLGYNFNPVSFFFCEDRSGTTETIVAEVNNTFGETHNYWLRRPEGGGSSLQYRFQKEFHVSPFMEMNQQYEWSFASSGDSVIIQTNSLENRQHMFDATLRLEPREWSRANLHRVLGRYPWMTLKVITTIHWQALRLWGKDVPLVHHPGAGKFARAKVQHFAASWSAGAAKKARSEPLRESGPQKPPPSKAAMAASCGEQPSGPNYPRLEPK